MFGRKKPKPTIDDHPAVQAYLVAAANMQEATEDVKRSAEALEEQTEKLSDVLERLENLHI